MKKTAAKKGTLGRIFSMVHEFYPVMFLATVCLIIFNAIVSSVPTIFMQKIIAVVEENWQSGWDAAG